MNYDTWKTTEPVDEPELCRCGDREPEPGKDGYCESCANDKVIDLIYELRDHWHLAPEIARLGVKQLLKEMP